MCFSFPALTLNFFEHSKTLKYLLFPLKMMYIYIMCCVVIIWWVWNVNTGHIWTENHTDKKKF